MCFSINFISLYQHLFSAAMWSVVTRSPASGCFKCHYLSLSSFGLVVWLIPLYYGILCSQVPDLYGSKHRSPRVLLTPLRLPSVSTLHLPGVSCKQLFSKTTVTIYPLHIGSPNCKSKPIQIQHGLRSPFVSLIVLAEGFLRYLRAMLGDTWHATIFHASQL